MGVMIRDFPPRQPKSQVKEEFPPLEEEPEEGSAAEADVAEAEIQFAKLNFEQYQTDPVRNCALIDVLARYYLAD